MPKEIKCKSCGRQVEDDLSGKNKFCKRCKELHRDEVVDNSEEEL